MELYKSHDYVIDSSIIRGRVRYYCEGGEVEPPTEFEDGVKRMIEVSSSLDLFLALSMSSRHDSPLGFLAVFGNPQQLRLIPSKSFRIRGFLSLNWTSDAPVECLTGILKARYCLVLGWMNSRLVSTCLIGSSFRSVDVVIFPPQPVLWVK